MIWPKLDVLLSDISSEEKKELLKEIPRLLESSLNNWWDTFLISEIKSCSIDDFVWMKAIILSYLQKDFSEWLTQWRWNNMINFAFYDIFVIAWFTYLNKSTDSIWKQFIYSNMNFWVWSIAIHQKIVEAGWYIHPSPNDIIRLVKETLNRKLSNSKNSCPFSDIWWEQIVFVDTLWDFFKNEVIPLLIKKFWKKITKNPRFMWIWE
jgi:hypothetical protein